MTDPSRTMYSFNSAVERRLVWLLALTQFTVIFDFMVMMPLGPQIMQSYRITPAAFASAVSAYSWCSGISGLFAATYIDRFNRRSLLFAMYALFAVSNLACANAGSFALLLAARAFAGLSGGVMGSVIMAIVGDVIPAERRGGATGTIMTAFSLAAVIGVPTGIALGANFGWGTAFFLIFALSVIIGAVGRWSVPSLGLHLQRQMPSWTSVFPDLWRLLIVSSHRRAFTLTFVMMCSHMLVIPFISPIMVANHGVSPASLSWLYIAGGAAPFFASRFIGRMSDRYGHRLVFRIMLVYSFAPVLIMTHLPKVPFLALVALFALFTVAMTGRMVPLQALMITVPRPEARGAFLSANSSFQSLGSGCGAWIGGILLSNAPDGKIAGFGTNGWLAIGLGLVVMWGVGRVQIEPRMLAPWPRAILP